MSQITFIIANNVAININQFIQINTVSIMLGIELQLFNILLSNNFTAGATTRY
jgi:hypothetical protein